MAPQVALPIYIANMLNGLKAKSIEDDAQLAIMGHPNALRLVPKESASDWTIMQSFRIPTLRHTLANRGSGHVWRTAVRELIDGVDDMRVFSSAHEKGYGASRESDSHSNTLALHTTTSHSNTLPLHFKFAVSVDAQRALASKGKREIQRRRHTRRCTARGMKCQV